MQIKCKDINSTYTTTQFYYLNAFGSFVFALRSPPRGGDRWMPLFSFMTVGVYSPDLESLHFGCHCCRLWLLLPSATHLCGTVGSGGSTPLIWTEHAYKVSGIILSHVCEITFWCLIHHKTKQVCSHKFRCIYWSLYSDFSNNQRHSIFSSTVPLVFTFCKRMP